MYGFREIDEKQITPIAGSQEVIPENHMFVCFTGRWYPIDNPLWILTEAIPALPAIQFHLWIKLTWTSSTENQGTLELNQFQHPHPVLWRSLQRI